MSTLTLRSYRGESDLSPIVELINTCAIADNLVDSYTTVEELRLEFNEPSANPERDLRLWEDSDGKLIGFASIWVPESGETVDGVLWFNVHPTMRDCGLETEMLAWAEARMQQVGRERSVPVSVHVPVRETLTDRIALLQRHGFEPVRYFYRMERSLHDPLPAFELPAGFTVRSLKGEPEVQAWVDLFNQSFIDHWNHHPMTLDECLYWLNHKPNYCPDLDLVAIAPDGTFAAFCYSEIDPEYNNRMGFQLGSIHLLGTRRGFRRIGLGRAMLLAGLHKLKAAGMEVARLGVDTQNSSGAKHLYESVGFRQVFTSIVFAKVVYRA